MTEDLPTQAEAAYEGVVDTKAKAQGFAAWARGDKSCPHAINSRARVDWRKGWNLANEGRQLYES